MDYLISGRITASAPKGGQDLVKRKPAGAEGDGGQDSQRQGDPGADEDRQPESPAMGLHSR